MKTLMFTADSSVAYAELGYLIDGQDWLKWRRSELPLFMLRREKCIFWRWFCLIRLHCLNDTEMHPMQIRRFQTGTRMSQLVIYGGFAFTAGQVADNTELGVKGQTRQILGKIDHLLGETGTDRAKILSANIWLAKYESFADLNEVWDAWVPGGQYTSACMRRVQAGIASIRG